MSFDIFGTQEKLEKGDNNLNKGDNNLEKGDNESKKGDNELKKGDNDLEKGDNKDIDQDIHNAASKIQAGFRGHKTRKEVKSKKQVNDMHTFIQKQLISYSVFYLLHCFTMHNAQNSKLSPLFPTNRFICLVLCENGNYMKLILILQRKIFLFLGNFTFFKLTWNLKNS